MEKRTERRVWEETANGNDTECRQEERATRPTLEERNFMGANDVDNECLGDERFDEPSGTEEFGRSVKNEPHNSEGQEVE